MLLSSGVLDAMMAPIEQVLQRAAAGNIKIDALELCDLHHPKLFYDPPLHVLLIHTVLLSLSNRYGGTARVPLISARVLALAQKYMDTPLIRRSLNGSEAIARGCALYAAMTLPTFNNAKRIQLTDTTPYDSKLKTCVCLECLFHLLACSRVRLILAAMQFRWFLQHHHLPLLP